jgi:hypothetical protein
VCCWPFVGHFHSTRAGDSPHRRLDSRPSR